VLGQRQCQRQSTTASDTVSDSVDDSERPCMAWHGNLVKGTVDMRPCTEPVPDG